MTNLGDPITGWDLRFSFGAGQTVSQLWNGSVTQSGAAVSVRNAGWNGTVATNGTASFGFNGAWTGSNPAPTAFTLNGVACTGSPVTPTSSPTTSPSATPSQTPRPTATPTPTPTPTQTTGPITGNAAQLVADMGKGWNLGNQLEANINGVPSETAWGNPVVDERPDRPGQGLRLHDDPDPGLLPRQDRLRPELHRRLRLARPDQAGRRPTPTTAGCT